MDKRLNRQKWIEALRSGDYKQARLTLKRGNSFCCLGVACDVYRRETGLGDWSEHGYFQPYDENQHLPSEVVDWYGLSTELGWFEDVNGKLSHLAYENDSLKSTFKKIANIIESEPKGFLKK